MAPDTVTQEHIDEACALQAVAGNHTYGMKDMIKRFKAFIP